MTDAALRGKPDAGNPHVRFDEGEVAPAATPRRGSLLYKKLMIIAAIVCAAAANAATVNWNTGSAIKPDGSTSAGNGTLNIYVWTVSESTYNNTALGAIWEAYGNETISSITGYDASKTGLGGSLGGKAAIENVANNTTLYGIIITTYDSDKDGTVDMYAVNKAIGSVNDSGTATSPGGLAKFVGGGTSGTPVTWETPAAPVPEPTSGLLMLLGVAGLALRRKRA